MSKNRLALHLVAVIAIVFFVFLAIGSAGSTPKSVTSTDETVEGGVTSSKGTVNQVPTDPKPFDSLGLVWATTTRQYDGKNNLIAGSKEGIVIMLLREAQKIGGHDILNLRVDETVSYSTTQETTSSGTRTVTIKTVTYVGSALAIKYK